MTLETIFIRFCFRCFHLLGRVLVFFFFPTIKRLILWRATKLHINYNGPNPDDIQVLSDNFYKKIATDFSLGFGEGYLDGDWDAKDLVGALGRSMRYGAVKEIGHPLTFLYGWFNLQKQGQDADVAAEHYSFGNDWYENLIGPSMQYTCGYWKTAKTLEEAQFDKMELIARKLKLEPGMRILDLGCGWGSFAIHLATHHRVSVVCVTNSEEQGKYIKSKIKSLPQIQVLVCDYRVIKNNYNKEFDRVTAIGLTEHIGLKNLGTFFNIIRNSMKDDGLVLLQTIMRNYEYMKYGNEAFTHKYIFPNAWGTSTKELTSAIQGILTLEDWVSHGYYYVKTLEAWRANLHKMWPKFQGQYNERVFRMWEIYMCTSIAFFKERQLVLSQIVLSKAGVPSLGYVAVR